ncbi:MAG: S8 family peptidase [Thermoanaerobaculia bacterium]
MQKAMVAAAMCLMAATVFAGNGSIHKKKRPIKGSYIVMLGDDIGAADVKGIAHQLAGKHGGKVTDVWTNATRGFAVQMMEQGALAMAQDPRVAVVEEDEYAEVLEWCYSYCYPTQTSSGCADGTVPWQLDRIDQPGDLDGEFQHCNNPGYLTRAYVIDSGIRSHDDFLDDNGASRLASGITYINDGRGTDDCFSHGTHVASFLAGRHSGPAKDAILVPVRVLDCNGNGKASDVVSAINWVTADHIAPGPAVLNISLNFSYSAQMNAAVDNAVTDGIVVVVGAGNTYGSNNCASSPASAPRAITVGASTKMDSRATFSSTGPCIDIFAPGEAVGGAHWPTTGAWNCNPGWNGTSMASPLVAGVAAVLYDALFYDNGNYEGPEGLTWIIINASVKNALGNMTYGTPNRLLQMPLGWGKCQKFKCWEWRESCTPDS